MDNDSRFIKVVKILIENPFIDIKFLITFYGYVAEQRHIDYIKDVLSNKKIISTLKSNIKVERSHTNPVTPPVTPPDNPPGSLTASSATITNNSETNTNSDTDSDSYSDSCSDSLYILL
jgi:Sec7-like guanine-nucleotide exchange factor